MNDEQRFSATVWAMVALGAVVTGLVIAFVAGFLVGHFTGHTKTTTVAASEVNAGEATARREEAEAEEAAEAEAEEQAEVEEKAKAEKEAAAEARAEKEAKAEKGAGGGTAQLEEGKQVFVASGCASCHTLAAAGATGTVGPDLDEVLPGKGAAFIRESIVEPEAQIAPGYSAGIMPTTFKASLSSSELEAVVAFLAQEAGK